MTRRQIRLGHCYRCIYTWRMRRRYPTMCPRCKSRLWTVPKILPVKLGNGLGIEEVLAPHRDEILRLARKHGARSIRVFGSVRRREADEKSDVDLLVEWGPDVDLLDTAAFRRQVRESIGRKVDAVEEGFLHWAIRPQVLAEAVPL
ncbi:MAG: nucleotidyltransferase domain-containing protein [Thermoplasmata archaeon]